MNAMRKITRVRSALPVALALFLLAAHAPDANANRPFLVDDARTVGQWGFEAIWQTFLAVDDGVDVATEATFTFGVIDPL